MQAAARGADFPAAGLFLDAQREGALTTPEQTAEKLVTLLLSDDFGEAAVIERI